MGDHRRAGSGGDHDVVGVLEYVEKMARNLPGFLAIAAVERRLAAAGLALRKVHAEAQMLQDVDHSHPDSGEQLVDNAGDK